jgi:hypothetical protein
MAQMLGVSPDSIRKYKYRIKKKVQHYHEKMSIEDFVEELVVISNKKS